MQSATALLLLSPTANELWCDSAVGGYGYDLQVLERLVRGERSAVAAYGQVLGLAGVAGSRGTVSRLRREHCSAVRVLVRRMHELGGQPPRTAGAWGALAVAIEGGARVLGTRSALRVLRTGEQKGLRDYERAVQRAALTARTHLLIRDRLIPATRRHVSMLEGLI